MSLLQKQLLYLTCVCKWQFFSEYFFLLFSLPLFKSIFKNSTINEDISFLYFTKGKKKRESYLCCNVTVRHRLPTTFLYTAAIWLFSRVFQHSNLGIQVTVHEANRAFIFIFICLLLFKSDEWMVC